jgi:hypothetical protein
MLDAIATAQVFADIVCIRLKLSGRGMSDFAIHPMAAIFGEAVPTMSRISPP